jgi:serine/threonine protein phosphatase PrpC
LLARLGDADWWWGRGVLDILLVPFPCAVTFRQLAPADVCLIAATDGVWDVLGYVPAVKLVADVIAEGGSAEEAATALCSEAVREASGSNCVHVTEGVEADNTTAAIFLFPEL